MATPSRPLPSSGTVQTGDPPVGRRERVSWYLYDLANQMFPFIVVSFVFNPWIVDRLGATDAHYTVAFSASMLVALLMAPLIGAVTDRIGRRPVLLTTTIVAVSSIALLGVGELLGLPRGATLTIALLFFVVANLGFQLGVVAYDAFLPTITIPDRLGFTGGVGIGVGYVGAFVALGLMAVVLGVLGLGQPVLFVFAGVFFLLLALPALIFLRDRGRLSGAPLSTLTRDSFHSALDALKGLPKDRVLFRFLATRFFYADAINTMILVMGVYAIFEVGFVEDSAAYFTLLGLGILFAVLSAPLWGLLVDRIGPRHTLMIVLMGWCLVFSLTLIHPVLALPLELFYLIGALVGVFLAGTWTSDRPLLVGVAPPKRIGEWFGLYALAGRFAAITGPLTWALIVNVLFPGHPGARQFGILSILATMLVAVFLLRNLPDPFVKGPGPLARAAPWGDGSGLPLRRPWHLPLRAPFILLYLAANWVIFFSLNPVPHPDAILDIPRERLEGFLIFERLYFWLPDFTEAPLTAILSIITAPLVNVHLIQLVYVTVLLVLFALVFEVREGSTRLVMIFFATSAIGALFAAVSHLVLSAFLDWPILEEAEGIAWSGGSAGAFGLMGALAARARVWWPLLAFFVLWEVNVAYWFLKSFTPAFHLSALFAGFLLARFFVPLKAPPGTRHLADLDQDGPGGATVSTSASPGRSAAPRQGSPP